jgi:DNA-binding transcriptional LysR family regulator
MDFEQIRTFLEVTESGSFIAASEVLNVTQSTVSARIKELEYRLGQSLFIRRRSGVLLTTAGHRFLPHAVRLMHVLQQARHDVALSPETSAVISVGGQYSLWERILQPWLSRMRNELASLAVRAEVGTHESLMRQLSEGLLDFAVLYSPEARPGFELEVLLEEELILVATSRLHAGPGSEDYVFVDWGPDFEIWHGGMFPAFSAPKLRAGLGVLGLNHILANGGAGYFDRKLVKPLIKGNALYPVPSAPEFIRPAHLVYASDTDAPGVIEAVQLLRSLAAA